MTENNQFQIIHLGNPYDFVVKDHNTNKTYGTFQGDEKSLMDLLNELNDKNHNLQESRRELITANNQYRRKLNELNDENNELKSLCKVLITHIKKNSIAFVIDEKIRRLLE